MNARNLLAPAAVLIILVLAGCKGESSADAPRHWVSVPALPVIQEAVFNLAPSFEGQRSPVLMSAVCSLAQGNASQEQVNAQLAHLGIDATKLPQHSTDATSLLVNGDKAAQATACAAYLATSVLLPADNAEFLADQQKVEPGKAPSVAQVDQARLRHVLPIKVARARSNADLFALIATQLQSQPGLTREQARDEAGRLFARLAPTYLARIEQRIPLARAHYSMQRLDTGGFAFSNDAGTRFDYTPENGLVLWQYGQVWYGKGQLLGHDMRLQLAYFDEQVGALLAPAKGQ